MGVNKLYFTLDNLIYNCTVKKDDTIEITLPRRSPNSLNNKKNFSLVSTEQIRIKVFLNVLTNKIPTLNIIGEDEEVSIAYYNVIDIVPNSQSVLSFTTTDGGLHWLIDYEKYSDSDIPPTPSENVIKVNDKTGPVVNLTAEDINLIPEEPEQPVVSIQQQFKTVDNMISAIENTITDLEDIVIVTPVI